MKNKINVLVILDDLSVVNAFVVLDENKRLLDKLNEQGMFLAVFVKKDSKVVMLNKTKMISIEEVD